MNDAVEEVLQQWARERPDVDVSGMAVIGRISRLARQLEARLVPVFATHGLEPWEFDVLATLRRSGDPFALTAGQLAESSMITTGTLTNRVDRLEQRGLVERRKADDDGRVVLVALTKLGCEVVDAALPAHANNELVLMRGLSTEEREELARLLARLASSVD